MGGAVQAGGGEGWFGPLQAIPKSLTFDHISSLGHDMLDLPGPVTFHFRWTPSS